MSCFVILITYKIKLINQLHLWVILRTRSINFSWIKNLNFTFISVFLNYTILVTHAISAFCTYWFYRINQLKKILIIMDYYLKCYDLFIFSSFFFFGGGGGLGGRRWGCETPCIRTFSMDWSSNRCWSGKPWCISKVYLSLFIISIVSMTLQISLVYHLYLN